MRGQETIARDARQGIAQLGQFDTLQIVDLDKRFGATQALKGARLSLRSGEVHGLLGENGSGKSTMLKILAGVHLPDAGRLTVDEAVAPFPRSPIAANRMGIATVFQETLVVPGQSVLENILLGRDGLTRRVGTGRKSRRDVAASVLDDLFRTPPNLDTPVEELSLGVKQACCIARALLRDPALLLLDEATSALDMETRDRLFGIIKRRSMTTVLISHRMEEVESIANRLTVMRSGHTVGTFARGEVSRNELLSLMVGEERLATHRRVGSSPSKTTVMTVSDLRLSDGATPVRFALQRGEIVGLAGLDGHGQDEFLASLSGYSPHNGRIQVVSDRGTHVIDSPRSARRAGVAYVPRDRGREALIRGRSILENFAMRTLKDDKDWGLVSDSKSRFRLRSYVEALQIKLGDESRDAIETLSGGNQQKVLIARWLATDPQVLLLHDPTRGIDLGAKRDLYKLMDELSQSGMSVVMLSSEIDEHVELMDRVLVFRAGEVSAELSGAALTQQAIVRAYFEKGIPS